MTPDPSKELHCAQCQTLLREGQDREATDDGIFCRPCFDSLTEQVRHAVAAQGQGINYPMALIGALAGGAIGVVAWWGFTVLTKLAFGLVAVVIGFTVGKGILIGSGHRRSRNLQILSAAIATLSFFYASYLVTRSFVQKAWEESGKGGVLPWVPSPELFYNVVRLSFGLMDLVFLAIVVYQAWKIPAPLDLKT